jgi:hypothetical protein
MTGDAQNRDGLPSTFVAVTANAIVSAVQMYFAPLRAAISVIRSASEGRGVEFVAGAKDRSDEAGTPRTVA